MESIMKHQITTEKQAIQLTNIIITSQILLNRLSDYKADYPLKQILKQNANRLLENLQRIEREYYDELDTVASEQMDVCYNVTDTFVQKIAGVDLADMENVMMIIDAYRKDPKAIEIITKKIMKVNK
jgi:hypothetical protein